MGVRCFTRMPAPAVLTVVVAAAILLPSLLHAQRTLTLEECMEIAVERSYASRNARAQVRASEASAEAARRALYTTVDLSFDLPSYSSILSPQFNTVTRRTEYFPLENLQWTGSLEITQPVIWTNSRLSVTGTLYRRDQSDRSPNGAFYRDFYTNLNIMLRQPLFVPNTQRMALRRAELSYEEAVADYRNQMLGVSYTVTEGFYRTYSSQEQLRIQRERVRQQEEAYATAMRKYTSGLIAEVEALQFEVDLAAARNDLLSAENEFISRANGFKLAIGLPLRDSLQLALTDTTFREAVIDVDVAVAAARRTRTDLQRARNNVERSDLSLREAESRRMIRGDVTLSYGLSNTNVAFNALYSDMRDARGAYLTITVPVFDWGRHAREVESAEASRESSIMTAEHLELSIEQEITDLARRIASSARRVDVLFKSRIIAEKAYDITGRRFEVGTIGSLDVAQAQQRLLQARLSALEALIDYNIALADLTRRTSYDFVRGGEVQLPR